VDLFMTRWRLVRKTKRPVALCGWNAYSVRQFERFKSAVELMVRRLSNEQSRLVPRRSCSTPKESLELACVCAGVISPRSALRARPAHRVVPRKYWSVRTKNGNERYWHPRNGGTQLTDDKYWSPLRTLASAGIWHSAHGTNLGRRRRFAGSKHDGACLRYRRRMMYCPCPHYKHFFVSTSEIASCGHVPALHRTKSAVHFPSDTGLVSSSCTKQLWVAFAVRGSVPKCPSPSRNLPHQVDSQLFKSCTEEKEDCSKRLNNLR
jgi:hypothetical protein